jgi:hypothetical protein
MSYDFTTAASKAYGDNMKLVGTKWCIYTGDPNLDGFVDFSDLSMIDNDSYNYTSGYVVTDLNGDQFVDFTDLGLCDNNAYTYTSVYYPAKKLESAKKPGQKAITNAPGIPVKK